MYTMQQLLAHAPGHPVNQRLVDTAIELANQHIDAGGWPGTAAMYLEDGSIVTSIAVDTLNDKANLCHETGAICEAFKRKQKVISTVCVNREPSGRMIIFPPCGICQERLFTFGPQVEAAVPLVEDNTQWASKPIGELQPHYWGIAFADKYWPEITEQIKLKG